MEVSRIAALTARFVSSFILPGAAGPVRSAWSYGEIWTPDHTTREDAAQPELICRAIACRKDAHGEREVTSLATLAAMLSGSASSERLEAMDAFKDSAAALRIPSGSCLVGNAYAQRSPQHLEDISAAQETELLRRDAALRAGFTSAVAFPVFRKIDSGPSQVSAVVILFSPRRAGVCPAAHTALSRLHVKCESSPADGAFFIPPDVTLSFLPPNHKKSSRAASPTTATAPKGSVAGAAPALSVNVALASCSVPSSPPASSRPASPGPVTPTPLCTSAKPLIPSIPTSAFFLPPPPVAAASASMRPAKRPAPASDADGASSDPAGKRAREMRSPTPPPPPAHNSEVAEVNSKLENLAGAALLLSMRHNS
eukprot:tig00021434_g21370.t1